MVSRTQKRVFYALFGVPVKLNGLLYRHFRQPANDIDVHVGCGQKSYLPGWVNLDANFLSARIDVWANVLDGLPFRDGSVKRFYSFHVVEHLPDALLPEHFNEMFRALVPGGAIRIGGPDAGNAAFKFCEDDAAWFPDWPDKRKSTGGRLANFLLCRGEHLTLLSRGYLSEMAQNAGFVNIQFCLPGKESQWFGPEVLQTEQETDLEHPHSVILEAIKPR